MKRFGILLLCILLLCLTACGQAEEESETLGVSFTIRENPEPTEVFFDNPVPNLEMYEQSKAVDNDAMKALLLGSVFGEDGDALVLWTQKITYALDGNFTQADSDAVAAFAQRAARIAGFPGIAESTVQNANVILRFEDNCTTPSFRRETDSGSNCTGAQVTIPAGLSGQELRATVEQQLTKVCGLQYTVDSTLDSILSTPYGASHATETDWKMLEFLYGETENGMSRSSVETAFDRFYAQ